MIAALPCVLEGSESGAEQQSTDAEWENVWNSSGMVDARLVMEQYFATSAEVSQEEADEFWAELKAMSAAELKFWLARFDYERQGRAQIAANNDQLRRYKLGVAKVERSRRENVQELFRRSMNKSASLAQNRAEKSLNRTSRAHKDKRRYRGFRFGFWFRF
jgi:hypothetical protein